MPISVSLNNSNSTHPLYKPTHLCISNSLLVVPVRVELTSSGPKPDVLPLHHRTIILILRFPPSSVVLCISNSLLSRRRRIHTYHFPVPMTVALLIRRFSVLLLLSGRSESNRPTDSTKLPMPKALVTPRNCCDRICTYIFGPLAPRSNSATLFLLPFIGCTSQLLINSTCRCHS